MYKLNKQTGNPNISIYQLCLVAIAVCINLAGGQVALTLRLPIYLDSIGTILTGVLLGPFYGMLPNLLSGIISGVTTDIYALYFAPAGMLVGFMAGVVCRGDRIKKAWIFLSAFLITVPGTIASSLICAGLFGGITSSGSAVFVQLLAKTLLGMTASIFTVQIFTDYLDRTISLLAVVYLLRVLPADFKQKWQRGTKGGIRHGNTGREIQ